MINITIDSMIFTNTTGTVLTTGAFNICAHHQTLGTPVDLCIIQRENTRQLTYIPECPQCTWDVWFCHCRSAWCYYCDLTTVFSIAHPCSVYFGSMYGSSLPNMPISALPNLAASSSDILLSPRMPSTDNAWRVSTADSGKRFSICARMLYPFWKLCMSWGEL